MTSDRVDAVAYEAPSITDRTPIDRPLIGGATSVVFSAVFRPL